MKAQEIIVATIEKLSAKYNFKWKNLSRLSLAELHFIMSVMSSGYIHGECFKKIAVDQEQREKMINEVLAKLIKETTLVNLEYGKEAQNDE